MRPMLPHLIDPSAAPLRMLHGHPTAGICHAGKSVARRRAPPDSSANYSTMMRASAITFPHIAQSRSISALSSAGEE
jgi:hypothetical protein